MKTKWTGIIEKWKLVPLVNELTNKTSSINLYYIHYSLGKINYYFYNNNCYKKWALGIYYAAHMNTCSLFRVRCTSFHIHSHLLTFFLCFIVLFKCCRFMRKCLRKHSCMSSPFSIAILNGTCSLRAPILLCGDVPAIKQLNYNNNYK